MSKPQQIEAPADSTGGRKSAAEQFVGTAPLSLNEITDIMVAIINDCVDGEITPEIQARFDAINVPLTAKVDGYKHMLLKLGAQAEARLAVAKPYLEEAKALQNKVERTKAFLHAVMLRMETRELLGNSSRIYLQKNGAKKLTYDPKAQVPRELQRITVVFTAAELDAVREHFGWASLSDSVVKRELDTDKLRDLLAKDEPLPVISVVDGNELRFIASLEAGDHVRVK